MAATATAPKPSKHIEDEKVLELCTELRGKGPVLIEDMPERLKDAAVLAKALVLGFILVGQRQYALIAKRVRVNDVPDEDNPRITRQQIEKDMVCDYSEEWTWTDLKGPKRKQLEELLQEKDDSLPKECRLHVRLTSEGLAQTV